MILKFVIKLTSKDIVQTSTSSKCNQPKYVKDDNWYKADFLGYEGLVEILCYRLAKAIDYPFDILEYKSCICLYGFSNIINREVIIDV